MGGGTEAFPELGRHCEDEDCRQLDFLPFRCDACRKVFCLEHRSYKDHNCPKADQSSRLVVVCDACSISIEKKAGESEEEILKQHVKSGKCDPSKKHKQKCPVRRCKEVLTFSNTNTCRSCGVKVCLKHRFPSEHSCSRSAVKAASSERLGVLLKPRSGTECREKDVKVPDRKGKVPSPASPTVKAF